MDDIWKFFADPSKTYTIGWGCTLICVLISYYVSTYLRHSSRMFTVMALLACAWVLLLGAYGARLDPNKDFTQVRPLVHLASDIASFLLVYIGGLLALEGAQGKAVGNTSWLQRVALGLLLLIVLPRQFDLGPLKADLMPLSVEQTELAVALALALVGWLSIAFGARAVSAGWPFYALVASLVFYSYLNVERTIDLWWDGSTPKRMTPFFIYSFAAAKLVFTCIFGYIVVRHAEAKTSA